MSKRLTVGLLPERSLGKTRAHAKDVRTHKCAGRWPHGLTPLLRGNMLEMTLSHLVKIADNAFRSQKTMNTLNFIHSRISKSASFKIAQPFIANLRFSCYFLKRKIGFIKQINCRLVKVIHRSQVCTIVLFYVKNKSALFEPMFTKSNSQLLI